MKLTIFAFVFAIFVALAAIQVESANSTANHIDGRALHFVLKIGDRRRTIEFFRDILGMTVLRHDEFNEKCDPHCSTPYDGRASRTMIGYGAESANYVLELGYNYTVSNYAHGNDFVSIRIESKQVYGKVTKSVHPYTFKQKDALTVEINSPDGYLFEVVDIENALPVITRTSLHSTNLTASKNYWQNYLGLKVISESAESLTLAYNNKESQLQLVSTKGQPVTHGGAFGRIAYASPEAQLAPLQNLILQKKENILIKLTTFTTPGKADVQVVILLDPNGHEICYVGSTGFDDLSKVDPKANQLLESAIASDKSDAWFKEHSKTKFVVSQ